MADSYPNIKLNYVIAFNATSSTYGLSCFQTMVNAFGSYSSVYGLGVEGEYTSGNSLSVMTTAMSYVTAVGKQFVNYYVNSGYIPAGGYLIYETSFPSATDGEYALTQATGSLYIGISSGYYSSFPFPGTATCPITSDTYGVNWNQCVVDTEIDTAISISPASARQFLEFCVGYDGSGSFTGVSGQTTTQLWDNPTLRNWVWTDLNYQSNFVLSTGQITGTTTSQTTDPPTTTTAIQTATSTTTMMHSTTNTTTITTMATQTQTSTTVVMETTTSISVLPVTTTTKVASSTVKQTTSAPSSSCEQASSCNQSPFDSTITIQSDAVSPVPIYVDGIAYTTPSIFAWPVGSNHTIVLGELSVNTPTGKSEFVGWSGGVNSTSASLTIKVGGDLSLLASYKNQYLVNVAFADAEGKSVSPQNVSIRGPAGAFNLTDSSLWLYSGTYQVTQAEWMDTNIGSSQDAPVTFAVADSKTIVVPLPIYDETIIATDVYGLPISGANVTMTEGNQIQELLTNSAGLAVFRQVPLGYLNGTVKYLGFNGDVRVSTPGEHTEYVIVTLSYPVLVTIFSVFVVGIYFAVRRIRQRPVRNPDFYS